MPPRRATLGAGTIIGSGTVSNRDTDGGPGQADRRRRRRLFLPRRSSHRRDDRRAARPVTPFLKARRHGPHLGGGRQASPDLRGDRADRRRLGKGEREAARNQRHGVAASAGRRRGRCGPAGLRRQASRSGYRNVAQRALAVGEATGAAEARSRATVSRRRSACAAAFRRRSGSFGAAPISALLRRRSNAHVAPVRRKLRQRP